MRDFSTENERSRILSDGRKSIRKSIVRLPPVVFIVISGVVLIVLWKLAAVMVGQEIIIPAPEATFREILILIRSPEFWAAVRQTIIRGGAGFVISLVSGIFVGVLTGAVPAARYVFAPVLSIVRTTPVMSVILLALIWFTSDLVPVFVGVLSAFPIITENVAEGFRNVDPDLIEMAYSYRMSRRKRLVHVYLPSLYPYILAASNAALGLTWKVVVAAEVLSQPIHAVGTGLADAKMNLDTAEVFAWTAVAIVLSALSEVIFRIILKRFRGRV